MTHEELFAEVNSIAKGRCCSVHRALRNYGSSESWMISLHERGGTMVLVQVYGDSPELALIDFCLALDGRGYDDDMAAA